MVNITPPSGETVVQKFVGNGESVTVPTGEVWKVSVSGGTRYSDASTGSDLVVTVNNKSCLGFTVGGTDQAERNHESTVFVDGDTISVESFDTSHTAYISGFEVSSSIDNTAISEQLGDSESISVPSGETWRISISSVNVASVGVSEFSTRVTINGDTAVSFAHGGAVAHQKSIIVTGGDTIAASGENDDSTRGVHISGFVIDS